MDEKQNAFDYIRNQILLFQNREKNSPCADGCAAKELVSKLNNILQNEETEGESSSEFPWQSTVVQKAMSNSVVEREILRNLDVRTLLTLRKTSKLWETRATAQLLSAPYENLLHVKFTWSEQLKAFCNQRESSLTKFMDLFKDSEMFPCAHFSFYGGLMNNPILILFLSKYGGRVHHLRFYPHSLETAALGNILFKWTPNLKSLALEPTSWTQLRNLPKNVRLLKLQKLILPKTKSNSLPPGGDLFKFIMTCAPNLTSIEDPNLAYIPQIVAAGKLVLVKSLKWDFLNNRDLTPNFLRFATARPQLTSMTFENVECIWDIRLIPALHTLFQLGQGTLTNVTGFEILGQVSGSASLRLRFPPLPKVTELKLRVGGHINSRMLPEGHTFSQLLPNLRFLHVEIQKLDLTNHSFTMQFNSSRSLERLKVSNSCPGLNQKQGRSSLRSHEGFRSQWLNSLGGLYPNITSLHLIIDKQGTDQVPKCMKIIPNFFKQLEQLVIEMSVDDEFSVSTKEMDRALTGLPPNVWEKLWTKVDPDLNFQNPAVLDRIRDAPSILDLKHLTFLAFEVQFKHNPGPFWTRMSKWYAFEPMEKRQGLKVNFRGYQRKNVQVTGDEI